MKFESTNDGWARAGVASHRVPLGSRISAPSGGRDTDPLHQPTRSEASLRDVALLELGVKSLLQRHYRSGVLIADPDDETRCVRFVVDGCVRLYRLSANGVEIFYDELGPGDVPMPILPGGALHKPMFARATMDTTIEILPKAAFTRLMEESAAFNRALLRVFSTWMIRLDQRLYETTALPMKTRLHAELFRLARRRNDGTLSIAPPPTHQDLAVRIGSQREAVSKELARLSRVGILKRDQASIVILKERPIREEIADCMDGAAGLAA